MKYKHFKLQMENIVPLQHYLSADKYRSLLNSNISVDDYGDIYVIEYKGKFFSVDGHHRLFWLYKQNVKEVNAVCELSDNDHRLYQMLADEALNVGFRNISDLENRFIKDYETYKKSWIDKCQSMLKEINSRKKE